MSTHPAVDAVTAKAMVVIQDRVVVPFSQWLADALRVCTETGRGLQIVTPLHSRLSMPLRLVLTGPNSRWVVRDDNADGYYDGLTGVPLYWDGAAFVPVPDARDYAPAYTTRPTDLIGAQLTLTFQVRQDQVEALGAAVEQLCMSLTGQEPAGWGTAEPAANLWRRDDVAGLYQRRAPRATWLTVVGGGRRSALGTMLLTPAQAAVEETVTLVVGCGYPRPADRRHAVADAVVRPGRRPVTGRLAALPAADEPAPSVPGVIGGFGPRVRPPGRSRRADRAAGGGRGAGET
jgi:hypothetical protein